MNPMDDRKLWTAEELEKLSPSERNEIIRAGVVTDMDEVPPEFLARIRANVLDHIESTESAATTDR